MPQPAFTRTPQAMADRYSPDERSALMARIRAQIPVPNSPCVVSSIPSATVFVCTDATCRAPLIWFYPSTVLLSSFTDVSGTNTPAAAVGVYRRPTSPTGTLSSPGTSNAMPSLELHWNDSAGAS